MGLIDIYYQYMVETRDTRTISWPLLSVPALILILFNYFYFIFGCGPRFMKNRPAYDLRNLIRVYNAFEIVANFILVYQFIQAGFINESLCKPVAFAMQPQKMQIANLIWWTYMLKTVDLVETFIFILRKKNRQVSVLHVHHHAMSVFLTWLSARYYAGGLGCVLVVINCCVHVCMYTYYFLSSLNPTVQKMINPYKQVLTGIQIVQLVVILLYLLATYIMDCEYPKILIFITFPNIFINLYFFFDFYKKNYTKSKAKSVKQAQ